MQLAVAPAELFHELPHFPRQLGFRAQALLQPFADRVADRARCLVIDLVEIADVLCSLLHVDSLDGFRFAGHATFKCKVQVQGSGARFK